jgi:hypothetical protein
MRFGSPKWKFRVKPYFVPGGGVLAGGGDVQRLEHATGDRELLRLNW